MPGMSLIYLISQPRAGSTLLQRILGGHPQIFTVTEPWIMLHPVYAMRDKVIKSEYDSHLSKKALAEYLSGQCDGNDTFDRAVKAYALELYGAAKGYKGQKYFLDKTPRYYYVIDEIARMFPEAKIIFMLRNPLAVLHSIYYTWVINEWTRLSTYRADLLSAPDKIMDGIENHAERSMTVRYEDLVSAPHDVVEKITGFLDVEYHRDLIEYGSRSPLEGHMGDKATINRHSSPIPDRSDNWKHASDPVVLSLLRYYLKELGRNSVERMGYSFDEMLEHVGNATEDSRVPWDIVIRPRSEWSYFDQHRYQYAEAVSEDGRLKSGLGLVLKLARDIRTLTRRKSAYQ